MGKKRILIVDDEETYARMMKLVIEQTGFYEVEYENHASRALGKAREFRPNLILLDVVMPEMDGGDVAAKIHDDPSLKNVPIVFLTALISGREMNHGVAERGGALYLGKLASDAELFECIQQHIS